MGAACSQKTQALLVPKMFRLKDPDEIVDLLTHSWEGYANYTERIVSAKLQIGTDFETNEPLFSGITGEFLLDHLHEEKGARGVLAQIGITNKAHVEDIIEKLFSLTDRVYLQDLWLSTGGSEVVWLGDKIISPTTWKRREGWSDNSPRVCSWTGVQTQGAVGQWGRVCALDLASNGLTGTLPSSIAMLTGLEGLILSSNHLIGVIPPELGSMKSLRFLYLDNNQLEGELPDQLGGMKQLQRLHVNGNQLEGEIPWHFGLCENLVELNLHDNKLQGNVPNSFANLHHLVNLNVSSNKLSGPVPDFLGLLSTLERLNLSGNDFEGTIPPTLAKLSELVTLGLSDNRLSGQVPSNFGAQVIVADGYLGKQIRYKKPNLGKLASLELAHTKLSGKLPKNVGRIKTLRHMSIAGTGIEVECLEDLPLGLQELLQGHVVEPKVVRDLRARHNELVAHGMPQGSDGYNKVMKSFFPVTKLRRSVTIGAPLMFVSDAGENLISREMPSTAAVWTDRSEEDSESSVRRGHGGTTTAEVAQSASNNSSSSPQHDEEEGGGGQSGGDLPPSSLAGAVTQEGSVAVARAGEASTAGGAEMSTATTAPTARSPPLSSPSPLQEPKSRRARGLRMNEEGTTLRRRTTQLHNAATFLPHLLAGAAAAGGGAGVARAGGTTGAGAAAGAGDAAATLREAHARASRAAAA